jgi:hypothetical protein
MRDPHDPEEDDMGQVLESARVFLDRANEPPALHARLRALADELEAYGFADDRLYMIANDLSALAKEAEVTS